MENSSLFKFLIIFSSLFLLSHSEVFSSDTKDEYWAIRNADLSKLSPKLRVKFHREITDLGIALDLQEEKARFKDKKKFSYEQFLNDFSQILIPMAYANGIDYCLFGGWISQRNGLCRRPDSKLGKEASHAARTFQYDEKHDCGSRSLFRCNPLVFGPGVDGKLSGKYKNLNGVGDNKNSSKYGLCVDVSKGFANVTRDCKAASNYLDKEHDRSDKWRMGRHKTGFRGYRNVVATGCKSKKLSKGLCGTVETSLQLTMAVNQVQNVAKEVNKTQSPNCVKPVKTTQYVSPCKDVQNTLAHLKNALTSVKSNKDCGFNNVTAKIVSKKNVCSIPGIEGGFDGNKQAKVIISFFDGKGKIAGKKEIFIKGLRTEKSILNSIQSHNETYAGEGQSFTKACKKSKGSMPKLSCNKPRNHLVDELEESALKLSSLGVVKNAKEMISCGSNSVEIGLGEAGNKKFARKKDCPVQYTTEFMKAFHNDHKMPKKAYVKFSKDGKSVVYPFTFPFENKKRSLYKRLAQSDGIREYCEAKEKAAAPAKTSSAKSKPNARQIRARKLANIDKAKKATLREKSIRERFKLDSSLYLSEDQLYKLEGLMKEPLFKAIPLKIDDKGRIIINVSDYTYVKDSIMGTVKSKFNGHIISGPNENEEIVISSMNEAKIRELYKSSGSVGDLKPNELNFHLERMQRERNIKKKDYTINGVERVGTNVRVEYRFPE